MVSLLRVRARAGQQRQLIVRPPKDVAVVIARGEHAQVRAGTLAVESTRRPARRATSQPPARVRSPSRCSAAPIRGCASAVPGVRNALDGTAKRRSPVLTRSVRKPPIPSPQQEERSSTGPKRAPCASSQPKSAAELAAAVGASLGSRDLRYFSFSFSRPSVH